MSAGQRPGFPNKKKAVCFMKKNTSPAFHSARPTFEEAAAPLSLGHLDREELVSGLQRFSLALSSEQIDQLDYFCGMVADWNRRMNLTAITGSQRDDPKTFAGQPCAAVGVFHPLWKPTDGRRSWSWIPICSIAYCSSRFTGSTVG